MTQAPEHVSKGWFWSQTQPKSCSTWDGCDLGKKLHLCFGFLICDTGQQLFPPPRRSRGTHSTKPGTHDKPPINLILLLQLVCVECPLLLSCTCHLPVEGCSWQPVLMERYRATGWSPSWMEASGTSVSGVPWPRLHLRQPSTTNPLTGADDLILFLN